MRRKFLHDISANSLQVIISQASGLAIFYVLSVYFSKNDFGEINWALAVLLAAFSILSLGIDQVMVQKIAAGEDPRKILSIYSFHVLTTGFIFYLVLLLIAFLFSDFQQSHSLLLFLGIGKMMIFFALPFKQLANGLEKFRALLIMSICSNTVRAVALIFFSFFTTLSLTSVIIIFITGDLIELLISVFITKKYALSVTRELLKNWEHEINQLNLITGSKGIFDVKVNGELLFSKKELDHYPEPGEISKLLIEKITDNALSVGGRTSQ